MVLSNMTNTQTTGPARDFIGYGRTPPFVIWPEGAKVAINLVLVYEEGSEYSWLDDNGRNDNWGEYNLTSSPSVRDLAARLAKATADACSGPVRFAATTR